MNISTQYNKDEKRLELIFSNGDKYSACYLEDQWDKEYSIDSLIGWFNTVLKKVGEDYDDLLESRTELARLVGIR